MIKNQNEKKLLQLHQNHNDIIENSNVFKSNFQIFDNIIDNNNINSNKVLNNNINHQKIFNN